MFEDATVSEIKRAIAILRRHGKHVGIACGAGKAALSFWMELGMDMVFAGADWNFVFESGKETLATIRGLQK